jgi:hypothetical protein
VSTPVDGYTSLSKPKPGEPRANQQEFSSLIGSLNYAVLATQVDIAYIAGRLAQYCADPAVRHYNAAIKVLRYLSGALDHRIKYGLRKALCGYSDADYGGAKDRHSISAYVYQLQGAVVA